MFAERIETGAIVSAPNQNHENFAQRTERLIPFFGAVTLSKLVALQSGQTLPQIDMWNSFGHQMDVAYKAQTRFDGASREEYASQLIDEKYRYFDSIGINTANRHIVRDDDLETMTWIQSKLQLLYNEGSIYEDTEAVSVCSLCGNIISVATVAFTACSRCKSHDFNIQKRQALFMDLDGDRQKYLAGKVLLPKNSGHINGQFATLPGRVLVSRQRDYGQSLDFLGYEGEVLDPKIGIALLPEMISARFGLKGITQIQGASTAKNTVPYTTLLSPDLEAKYMFINYAPKNISIGTIQEQGVDFFTKYLPLFMLDKTGDVSDEQLNALRSEHTKTKRKMTNALMYLRANEGEVTPLPNEDQVLLTQSLNSVAQQNIRNGVLNLRKYIFEKLGKTYVDTLKANGKKVAGNDLDQIETLLQEIF